MSMYDNTPADKKYTANTTGAPLCEQLERLAFSAQPFHPLEELTNLDGDHVVTDMSGPQAWIKADPADVANLEGWQ